MRESAATDAESANELRCGHFPDADTDAVRIGAPRAAHAVALPERQSDSADGHQCIRVGGIFYDLSPEPKPEHAFTLRDFAQS